MGSGEEPDGGKGSAACAVSIGSAWRAPKSNDESERRRFSGRCAMGDALDGAKLDASGWNGSCAAVGSVSWSTNCQLSAPLVTVVVCSGHNSSSNEE